MRSRSTWMIAAAEVVRVSEPKPATLIGQGAVDRLKELIEEQGIALVVVDAAITPVQQRNLEQAWKAKVIDRTGLILEIFGERARTKEGQLQVELAALSYQRSRLVKSWTHLERQRGGFGFIGGPGESQIEIDRRLIDERIVRIKRDLEDVKRTRALHRRARKRVPFPVVALVGYTNAGKSTLFNRLTKADVMAKDLLFATLDPTMRRVRLPGGRDIILSDTVGFISDLPTELVAAFRATLEEVLEADLILHVRDIAHPETDAQKADVEAVLEGLGLEHTVVHDMIEVLNKIDALPAEDAERDRRPGAPRSPGGGGLGADRRRLRPPAAGDRAAPGARPAGGDLSPRPRSRRRHRLALSAWRGAGAPRRRGGRQPHRPPLRRRPPALRNEPTCLAELEPQMKSPDVNKVAALIAEVAATEIQPRFRKLAAHEQREKGPGDIVTIADERAEAAMTPRLMELLPGSIVIGEEAAAKDPKLVERLLHDQVAWIVDPVDGTANFAEGKEEFVSMVALVRGDELIGSWIHLPMTGHTAIAERGAGATYRRRAPPETVAADGGAVPASSASASSARRRCIRGRRHCAGR